MKKLSVIIPVYNERNTIEQTFKAVEKSHAHGLEKEIIVVDDVSTDGTRELLKSIGSRPGYKFLFNEKNVGKGGSLRYGLEYSTGDFAIIQDADLEYDPNDYNKLLEPLLSGKSEVVYGSRYLGKKRRERGVSEQKWASFIANKVLTWFSNFLSGARVTDMETCYKCFTRNSLSKVLPKLVSTRFDIEPEITARVVSAGFTILEVPVSYSPRTEHAGKKIKWTDGFPALWAILKFNTGNFFRVRKFFIALLVALAVSSVIFISNFPLEQGDTGSYINSMQVLGGGNVPENFHPNRIMTSFLGLEIIILFSKIFGSVSIGWLFVNLIFYFSIPIIFYLLIYQIFKCKKTALIGSLLLAGNYALIFFGLTNLIDVPGWAFYTLSLLFLYKYSQSHKTADLLLSASAVGVGGLFKEYAFLGAVSIAVYVIIENWRSPKNILKKGIMTAVLALLPIALVFLYIYFKFDYTYLDWFRFAGAYYSYDSRFVEYVKALSSLWSLIGILFLCGLWVIWKKWGQMEKSKKIFLLAVLVSILPLFLWPAITQRILFPTVIFATLVSCFFIKKYESRWYLFFPVLLVYGAISFFTDYLLASVNLPF